MKYYIFILSLVILSACSVQKEVIVQNGWKDIVVIQDKEVYVDTLNIKQEGGYTYSYVKEVYMTENSIEAHKNKIRKGHRQDKNLESKMKKWENFKYNISYREYDCLNKRYRTLSVSDYDESGKLILKTVSNKDKTPWWNVGVDTMGDHTLFFICDYYN